MKEKLNTFAQIFFFVLFIPITESFILKFFLPVTVELDFSYLIIGFLALFFLIRGITKKESLQFKPNIKIISLNLLIGSLYYLFLLKAESSTDPSTFIYIFKHISLSFLILFTGIFYFIDFSCIFKYRLQFLFLLPLSFILVIYPTVNHFAWMYLCTSTCKIAYNVINFLGFKNISLVEHFRLVSPYFKISIFSPCSGLEGILMFIAVFSFFLIQLGNDLLKLKSIFLAYFIGIYYMYFLNIMRIVSYFLFGISVAKTSGSNEGANAAIRLFHSNVGWILYFIGISLFIAIWFYLSKRIIKGSFTS